MGNIDYILGTAFNWINHKDVNISVFLCQSAFTEFTVHRFSMHTHNKVTNMTPYQPGYHINLIYPVDPLEPDITGRKKVYQQIFGCINWLDICTPPNIYPALTFRA